jgi:alcohol dehydrogenase (NADP+)
LKYLRYLSGIIKFICPFSSDHPERSHGNSTVAALALNKTLSDLGLDYVDLYLMHWPVSTATSPPSTEYVETWKSMLTLPKSKALNLGVCNFSPAQLAAIIAATGTKPAVHQMEMHPYLPQADFVAAHEVLGIAITAYSPLGGYHPGLDFPPNLLKNPVVLTISEETGCSPAQIVLKWGIQRGTSVIPKSAHENHILDNLGSLDCELGEGSLEMVDALKEKYLTRYTNPSEAWGVKLFDGLEDA